MMQRKTETIELGFANEFDVVTADIGNGRFKLGAWVNKRRKTIDGIHACVEIDEARYARLTEEHGGGKSHWEYLKWKGRYFVVGAAALSEGNITPVQMQNKYRRDYYGVMFIALTLKLYNGNVPENINAWLGYPPAAASFRKELLSSVLGTWDIESLGRKRRIRVHSGLCWDEIIGGVKNVTKDDSGEDVRPERNTKDPVAALIAVDGPTIVIDVGYGTTDVIRLDKMGQPDYKKIAGRKVGIGQAIEEFVRVFNFRHKQYVSDAEEGISLERVYECFADPQHRVRVAGNTYIDCKDIYKAAVQRLVNAIADAYREMSGGSISYNYCLLTGGGAALLYHELCEQVFPQFAKAKAIFLAHDKNEMHLANVLGAMKMVPGLIAAAKRRVRQAQMEQ